MIKSLAVVVLSGVLLFGAVGVARADAHPLSLSLDRRSWSPVIERDVFDSNRRWVPGDRQVVTLWVRNDSGQSADLRVDVVDVHGTLELGRDMTMTARMNDQVVTAAGGGRLLAVDDLPEGPVPVVLTLAMPFSAANNTQLQALSLKLRVTLTQGTAAAPASGTAAPTDRDTRLAGTGGPPIWTLLAGLLMIGGGAKLGRTPTRRERA